MSALDTEVLLPGVSSGVSISPGTVAIKISNTSPYDCLYYGYGTVGDDWIPAGTEYMLYASTYFSGQINLTLFNNRAITPANPGVILLVAYFSNNDIPQGHWPITIPQSVVNTSSNMSNQLINVGNPPLQIVIQVQPSDAASETILADNSGNFQVKSDNAGTLLNLLRLIAGASPSVTIADTGITTEIKDDLTLDIDLFFAKASNPIIDSTNVMQFRVAGSNRIQIDSTGINLNASSRIQFLQGGGHGSISKLNMNGNATVGSGTTISHGLSSTPDMVIVTPRISQPGSATVGSCTWGSTTFQCTVGAGSAASWLALTNT